MQRDNNRYNLPESWLWTTIGEIAVLSSGGTPNRSNYSYFKGDIPWVKSGELNYNVILDTEEKISRKALEISGAKIIPANSLLIALYGSTVGKLATLGIPAATNQAVAAIITTKSVNKRFLFYYLIKNREMLLQKRIGGAQSNISQKILIEFSFPLPPLKEQNQIVEKVEEFFSELDHAEKILNKSQKQLEIYKYALLKKAFDGGLTKKWRKSQIEEKSNQLKDFKNNFEWVEKKIEDCVSFIGSGSTPKGGRNVYQNKGIPFIRSQNVYNNKLVLNDLVYITTETNDKMSRTKIEPKDVLLNITGSSIGRCTFVPNSFLVGNVNQHVCIIRVLHDDIYYKYLSFFLSSPIAQIHIKSINSGATREALTLNQIKNIKLPLCTYSEQIQISEELESRFTLIENLENEIRVALRKIILFRHTILKKAYEGKLVQQVLTDVSANLLLKQIQFEKNDYLNSIKNVATLKSNKKDYMETRKTIVEILNEIKEPISSAELWQKSTHEGDIEGFYTELKEIYDLLNEIKKDTTSFISLK